MSADDDLDAPLDRIDLPVRVVAGLRAVGATRLRDAASIAPEQLLELRNFGETSLRELNARLAEYGLQVGQDRLVGVAGRDRGAACGPDSPIEALRLSSRLLDTLQRLDVSTMRDAAGLCEHELLTQPNFGERSLRELKERLAEFGLSLGPHLFGVESLPLAAPGDVLRAPLASIGLSLRLRTVLHRLCVRSLSDATRITARELLEQPNIGVGTVQELERRLAQHGLRLREGEPSSSTRAKTARSASRGSGPSPLRADAPLDELAREILARRKSGRGFAVLVSLVGWDADGPRTLEAVGAQFGVTRERVRQIAKKSLATLAGRSVFMTRLGDALRELRRELPQPLAEADARMRASGLVSDAAGAAGVVDLASRLEVRHGLLSLDAASCRILLRKRHAKALQEIASAVGRLSDRWGAVNVEDLVHACAERLGKHFTSFRVKQLAGFVEGVEWLDAERTWVWRGAGPRNRVVIRIRKMLAVASPLTLSELRSGIARDYRMQGYSPPRAVLAEICRRLEFCSVDGQFVQRKGELPLDVLSPTEANLVRVLSANGGCMGTRALESAASGGGVGAPALWQKLSYSCVIAKPAPGVYALRGWRLEPAAISAACEIQEPRRRTVDCGWTPDGHPWCAIELSYAASRTGIVSVPAAIRRFVQGEHEIVLRDGLLGGALKVKKASAWGLHPVCARRGLEDGDVVILEWDVAARRVLLVIGADDALDRYQAGTANFWSSHDAEPEDEDDPE